MEYVESTETYSSLLSDPNIRPEPDFEGVSKDINDSATCGRRLSKAEESVMFSEDELSDGEGANRRMDKAIDERPEYSESPPNSLDPNDGSLTSKGPSEELQEPPTKRRKRNTGGVGSKGEENPASKSMSSNRTRRRKKGSDNEDKVGGHDDSLPSEIVIVKRTKDDEFLSFVKKFAAKTKRVKKEQNKALSLDKVNDMMESEKDASTAYCLALMLFLQKNVITIDNYSEQKGKRLVFKSEEGVKAFQAKRKKFPDDHNLILLEERFMNPYWKLPLGDKDRLRSLFENHSHVQVILNSIELTKFSDKKSDQESKIVKCITPTFRYEPVLKK